MEISAIVAGKYRLGRVLGRGATSVVMQAMHLQLHQPVAIKFLRPDVLEHPRVIQRFLREAQAAVRLRSEHVARVLDVGALDDGPPYMVLEYLEGADLASFPRSQLTIGSIVDLILQACEALSEAHALGIVHRDIKPANFFVTRYADGALLLKVLDFGISKIRTTGEPLTAPQIAMGTPAYMSPEQMRSPHDVDHRSDLWSLGVVLYELLQGAPPFLGDTLSSLVLEIANDPLPKLTVRLPGDLDAVVYRCLEKDPARRFQDAAELASALAKFARSEPQAAISVQRTRGILGAPVATRETDEAPVAPGVRASTVWRWLIASALGGAAAAILLSFTTAGSGEPADPWSSPPPQRAPGVSSSSGRNIPAPGAPTGPRGSAAPAPDVRQPDCPGVTAPAPSPPATASLPAPRVRAAAPSGMTRKPKPVTSPSESRRSGPTPVRPPAPPDDPVLEKRR
jgi:serine/threonine-protein kinase